MAIRAFTEWKKIPISLFELCLDTTLRCGQSFRWKKVGDEWICVLRGRVISLKQDPEHVHYRSMWPEDKATASDDTEALLRHYLNLSPKLANLYEQWSIADQNFKKRAPRFTGVRILKQDPWEALLGFICSSNNNISRISQMVNNLCLHYGPLIGHIDSQPFHDLPGPEALVVAGVEENLRRLGFGYRAQYITETARMVLHEKPPAWLDGLSNPDTSVENSEVEPDGRPGYRHAHEQLLELMGVGPKVADCVCLMGLGWSEAVPVDTHVWQIAQRDYGFGRGKHKSLTKATYDAIGGHFRGLWGREAGWAHSVLFTADLRAFSDKLKQKIEIDATEIKSSGESLKVTENVAVKRKIDWDGQAVKEEVVETVEIDTPRSRRAKRRGQS